MGNVKRIQILCVDIKRQEKMINFSHKGTIVIFFDFQNISEIISSNKVKLGSHAVIGQFTVFLLLQPYFQILPLAKMHHFFH